jgi:hypothetical protein
MQHNITSYQDLHKVLQSYIAYNMSRNVSELCYNFVAEMNLGTKDMVNQSWQDAKGGEGEEWSDMGDTVIAKLDIERIAVNPTRRGGSKVVNTIDLIFCPNHDLEFGQVNIRIRPHAHTKALNPELVATHIGGFFN